MPTHSSQPLVGLMGIASLCWPYGRRRSRCFVWEESDKDHIFLVCNDKKLVIVRCWLKHPCHRVRRRPTMNTILVWTLPLIRRSQEDRGMHSLFQTLSKPDDWRLLELKLEKGDHWRWPHKQVVGTNLYRQVGSSRIIILSSSARFTSTVSCDLGKAIEWTRRNVQRPLCQWTKESNGLIRRASGNMDEIIIWKIEWVTHKNTE